MNRLRAVARRLDPWAALLLGGLLAMGVVILLATPGPWQRVVGQEPPVRLEAPAPDDVALFVMAGRGGSCTGVVWLHLDAEKKALAAVVVAPRISGFSPTDGYAPVAAIAGSAGPSAAAAALGGALGVSIDAWIALDRKAMDLAVEAMVPMNEVRAARTRYREARAAWRGRGGEANAWATQYESLRVSLPQVPFEELGVVAFSNYVLGFGFVRSDLTLQGATSLAEALKEVDRDLVEVRAAPVVVERCRGGEVWHADASRVEPLRQSLALGIRPPETGRLITERARVARVLVVAPLARQAAARYAAEVRRRLAASAGAPVEVTLVSGDDERLAFRAARELDRRPALAALVAPAQPGAPRDGRGHQGVRDAARPPPGGGRLRPAAGVCGRAVVRRRGPGGPRGGGERRTPAGLLAVPSRPAPERARRGARRGRAQQRPDARARLLAGDARAAAHLDAPRVRLRGRAPHRRRRQQRLLDRHRAPAAASAPVGLSRRAPRARRRAPRPRPARAPSSPSGRASRAAALALAGDLGLPPGSVFRADDTPRKLVVTAGD